MRLLHRLCFPILIGPVFLGLFACAAFAQSSLTPDAAVPIQTQSTALTPDGLPAEAVLSEDSSLSLVASAIAAQSARNRWPAVQPVSATLQMSRQIHAIGLDTKHHIRIHLRSKTLTGRIVTITPDFFILQTSAPADFHIVYYADLKYAQVLQTPAEKFKKGGETALMTIMLLPFFPLFLAAGILGWDGC